MAIVIVSNCGIPSDNSSDYSPVSPADSGYEDTDVPTPEEKKKSLFLKVNLTSFSGSVNSVEA